MRTVAPVALLCSLLLAAAPARAQDTGALQREINGKKAAERSLSSAAAKLGALEQRASSDVDKLQRRLAAEQSELDRWTARLQRTVDDLRKTRRHLERLRARVLSGRATLAKLLRAAYETDKPDFITVVFGSHGFTDLLERFEFYDRVRDNDQSVIRDVRRARNATHTSERRLAKLEPRQREQTGAVRHQRDALAALGAVLERRRAVIAQAHAARLSALRATRAGRRHAEKTLAKIIAAQQRAARSVGPGGPWAIPWPIVQCESGGQNLPPNSAGASGYYQFLPQTWRNLGGSTPNAYQASKAEQDRLAARLWNGGRGASNWVCASIVGLG